MSPSAMFSGVKVNDLKKLLIFLSQQVSGSFGPILDYQWQFSKSAILDFWHSWISKVSGIDLTKISLKSVKQNVGT